MNAKLVGVAGIAALGGALLVLLVLALGDDEDDFAELAAENPAVAAALAAQEAARGADTPTPAGMPARGEVRFNGRALAPQQIQEIQSTYGVTPVAGSYWYDPASGLYGVVGQPTAGFMLPGHDYGPLAAGASGGRTGVFLNGRHLPQQEVMVFSAIWGTTIQPARYWMDGAGNVGYEGNPAPVGNLYAQAAQSRIGGIGGGGMGGGGGGGGDNIWSTRFSAGNYNALNTSGYVSVPGHGPVGYGLD